MSQDPLPFEGWEPYADGTSGQQGHASAAAEPGRRANIPVAYRLVHGAGERGLTWRELTNLTGWHHGQSSGALSNLHRSGSITRLFERRGRCGIYVTVGNVAGRPTIPHRRNPR